MKPYVPPLEGRRGKIRLDFNEDTEGFPWALPGMDPNEISAYPEYTPFTEKLCRAFGVQKERLILTNGSGDALSLIAATFIEPGYSTALTSYPTFPLIPHYLKIVGAKLIEVPSTPDFEFDTKVIETALSKKINVAVFASPDNPTGASLPAGRILEWCGKYPGTLFVVDQAYSEYAPESALPLENGIENLLITKTFSKAWGLAGLRLGIVVGDPRLIDYLRCVRAPYSVNSASLAAAARLLDCSKDVNAKAAKTMERKRELIDGVEKRGFRVKKGTANFFLVMAGKDAGNLSFFCREKGILIRDQSSKTGLDGIVRVSVGTDTENNALLECFDLYKRSRGVIFDLDDTLVDTSKSFDHVVSELVRKYSNKALDRLELSKLRSEGGFNDDWDAVCEILSRRGVKIPLEKIEREGIELYLKIAPEQETLMIEKEFLERLALRYRLFVVTGRRRTEYEPVWSSRLDGLFEKVFCRDDIPGIPPKPAPDILRAVIENEGLSGGYYIGNSVDDMRAAAGAGLEAIGVATTLDEKNLKNAGAFFVADKTSNIGKVFML